MTDKPLIVSTGTAGNLAAITKVYRMSWPQFAGWLTKPPPVMKSKDARGWYCCAEFKPEYRDSDNFVARYALTFDADHVDIFFLDEVREYFKGTAHAIYPTYSHTEEKPRFRCIVPLSRGVTYDEFQAISRRVAADLGIENFARESHVPAQCMFAPARPEQWPEPWAFADTTSPWLDADQVLARYEDWHDRTSWPHRVEHDVCHAGVASIQSVYEKTGVVGDFCRAFSFEQAVERFDLPYDKVSER